MRRGPARGASLGTYHGSGSPKRLGPEDRLEVGEHVLEVLSLDEIGRHHAASRLDLGPGVRERDRVPGERRSDGPVAAALAVTAGTALGEELPAVHTVARAATRGRGLGFRRVRLREDEDADDYGDEEHRRDDDEAVGGRHRGG